MYPRNGAIPVTWSAINPNKDHRIPSDHNGREILWEPEHSAASPGCRARSVTETATTSDTAITSSRTSSRVASPAYLSDEHGHTG